MSRILSSISGKNLGLDHKKTLLCPKGVVSGNHGDQFHAPSPNKVVLFDDFVDNTLAAGLLDTWLFTEGTDNTTSGAAVLAGGIGGVLRLTTGDVGTLAADTEQMTANALQFQASNGGLTFQTRIELSMITEVYVFVGFTDTVAASLEAPIVSAASANTITTNASDAVGFFFDTRMTADTWWAAGVKGNTDATHYNTGIAPTAVQYQTLRIEVDSSGNAAFFINGVAAGTVANAVTAATDLTPIITASRTGVVVPGTLTLDVDYVYAAMDRGGYNAAV
jgi:hypothetical protein